MLLIKCNYLQTLLIRYKFLMGLTPFIYYVYMNMILPQIFTLHYYINFSVKIKNLHQVFKTLKPENMTHYHYFTVQESHMALFHFIYIQIMSSKKR